MIPQLDQIIQLKIHGLGSSGEGVGYFNGFVVFVDGALPGEKILARMTKCQKRHGFADLVEIIERSPDRTEPACQYFGQCGGCQLMHLTYPKQLEIKRQRVVDAMQRIGKFENLNIAHCEPSFQSVGYRNKIQLPVRQGKNGIALGLFAKSSHQLIEIERCLIHSTIGEKAYQAILKIIKDTQIEAYDPASGKGEFRHLLIKSAVNTEEVLVVLVTNQDPSIPILQLAQAIMEEIPEVKGVVHNQHLENDNVILGNTYTVLKGQGHIKERLGHLLFKVSPASFFQVNPLQAEKLYAYALQLAELSGNETVLDVYCGVGTLSLFFAGQAKKVIGIECVSDAIADAIENAQLNGFDNVHFVCSPAEKYFVEYKREDEVCDVVLLNPPRKGCDASLLKEMQKLSPKKIIYISCDPATLARDLALLNGYGYQVDCIQPVDMFPQTAHVECVAKLTLL